MRRLKLLSLALPLVLLALSGGAANAALVRLDNESGHFVVLDDLTGRLWYRSPLDFSTRTIDNCNSYWCSGIAQIDTMIRGVNDRAYFGISAWHLATPEDMAELLNGNQAFDIATALVQLGVQECVDGIYASHPNYYSYPQPPWASYRVCRYTHTTQSLYQEAFPGSWVTAPIPIPPAILLFGSALGVMGWMRRKAAA